MAMNIRKVTLYPPGQEPTAAVVIIRHPDRRRLLGVKRKDEDAWGLPGGKVEHGETLEECACREVFEETHLVIRKFEMEHVENVHSTRTGRLIAVFEAIRWHGEPTAVEGPVEWLEPERLEVGSLGEFHKRIRRHL